MDGNLYIVRTYTTNGTNEALGDVIIFDGGNGSFIGPFIAPSPALANAFGLTVAPNGDFILSIGKLVGISDRKSTRLNSSHT